MILLRLNVGGVATCVILWCATGGPALAQQWLTEANQRIEQHRKADLTVRVVDSRGTPIPDAEVKLEMKRHTFGFGTAVPASWINDQSANGSMFREKLLENFNQVVFENDLKWPPWLGMWGPSFNWNNTEQALDWLDANNLPTRGHYLSWATWSGVDAWGNSENTETLPQRLLEHITEKVAMVGNRVTEWDVINHPVGWLNDTYENRIGLNFYNDIINHARNEVPEGVELWINEDNIIAGNGLANDYERIIKHLVDTGSAPDGIGFQGHFIEEWGRVSQTPISQLFGRIDRFAQLIPRLQVTEFDIDVGGNEALQGQLMNNYLTVMFSHADIEAITMWGFWGGAHWRGEDGALYRQDWTEKPSLTAYQNLVFDQWWTDETGLADTEGEILQRAFKGIYDITISYGDHQCTLSDYLLEEDGSLQLELSDFVLFAADFNGDGMVDATDLAIWEAAFGLTAAGDANGDEVTDGADFLFWQREYTGNLTAESTALAIPEPAAHQMLAAWFIITLLTARPVLR